MGILQKGRSRFWYDDRRWHGIAIEFQPSGFSKMSYLNVGISWFWYPKDFWSFDLGGRERAWAEFHDEVQFRKDFELLVDQAIDAISDRRSHFTTLRDAYQSALEIHKPNVRPGGWPDVNLGLLAALNGQWEQASSLLRFVADQASVDEWQMRQEEFCEQAISCLGSVDELRSWVENNIAECRNFLGLPQLEAPVLPPHQCIIMVLLMATKRHGRRCARTRGLGRNQAFGHPPGPVASS